MLYRMLSCVMLLFTVLYRPVLSNSSANYNYTITISYRRNSYDLLSDEMIERVYQGKQRSLVLPDWFSIISGTKWCGPGNIASSFEDLGYAYETDMCCREHDHCDDFIEAYQSRHNLTNTAPYTRLNCECDKKFYNCLKTANTLHSNTIGFVYFTTLNTKCFQNTYPINSCTRQRNFITPRCVEYKYNYEEEQKYQWFDLPFY